MRNVDHPWISKQEAATRLGLSVRTIESYVAKRELGSKLMPVPGGKPVTVVDAGDVDRKYAEQNRGAILPGLAVSGPDGEASALAPRSLTPEFAGAMMAAFRQALAAPVPDAQKPFVTLREASTCTGLPERLLKRLVRQKRLAAEPFRERPGPGGTELYFKTEDLRAIKLGKAEVSEDDVEEVRRLRDFRAGGAGGRA